MLTRWVSPLVTWICLTAVACAEPVGSILLDPNVTYQTICGWEVVAQAGQEDSAAFDRYKDQLFDLAVNEVGINRVRLEVHAGCENTLDHWKRFQEGQISYEAWSGIRYATINDNDDPNQISAAGFQFSALDDTIEKVVLPLRRRVAANGESLYVNLLYVAFTRQTDAGRPYIHDEPEEYAEFILAVVLHMKRKYGFTPDALEVLLEPDNVPQWNGTTLGHAIVATGNRLAANGLTPHVIAPSNTKMKNAIAYFDEMVKVPGALRHVKEFSYHRYRGFTDGDLRAIADRAIEHGLDTSMLEWWHGSNGYKTLHKDIKLGRNSAWQQGVVGAPAKWNDKTALYTIDDTDPDHPIVKMNDITKFTLHYFRHVRAGARRIQATSDHRACDPIAFVNVDGRRVVIVKARRSAGLIINGLPPGRYGVAYTTPGEVDRKLAEQTVGPGEPLRARIPSDGVLAAFQLVKGDPG